MKRFKRLLFGTAGIPLGTPNRNIINGLDYLKEITLDSMELEFVRSINITKDKSAEVKRKASENDVVLSAHGSYFINLASDDTEKVESSKKRIIDGATRAYESGAFSIVFHAAYYMGNDKHSVYKKVKREIEDIMHKLRNNNIDIWIRPETTGKPTQFGTPDELMELSSEVEGVLPCIDFAHLHARSNGKHNTYSETYRLLDDMEKKLGRGALNNMHIHMSGIEYGEKGEKRHLVLEESDFKFKEIMKAWKDFDIKGTVICESPNIEEDALRMKNYYYSL